MSKRILSMFFALCFALSVFIPSALAAEDAKQLTLDDAIKMALERNRDLKIQDLEVEKAEETLDDSRTNVSKGNTPTSNLLADQETVLNWTTYLSDETQYRIATKQLEALRQQMVVDVKTAYYDVLTAEKKLTTAEEALKLAKLQLQQARIKQEVGMSTKVEVQGVETSYQNANKDLVAATNALDEAKSKLATLLGVSGSFDYSLVDNSKYEQVDFTSKDYVVAKALSQRVEIWAADRLAEVTDRLKDFASNYKVGDIEASIKDLEAGNAKDKMKQQVESLYLSLETLDENYKTLEQNVKTLEEKNRVVNLQYEVGMATALQKQQTEQEYKEKLQQMRELVYNYDIAKTQLQVLTGDDLVSHYNKK
ncbi:TolC family protein [Peptococcaceae bacterium 1198_IL3148]